MLFSSYEKEVKTKRSKAEVVQSINSRAIVRDDKFRVSSRILSLYRGSIVVGNTRNDNTSTIVSFKITPSADFKAIAYLILLGGAITSGILLTLETVNSQISTNKFISWILATAVFWSIFYLLFKLMFKFSVNLQEESLEQLIKG